MDDRQDMGVPPSGSGLRPDGLSQSALSQAEPLVPNAGYTPGPWVRGKDGRPELRNENNLIMAPCGRLVAYAQMTDADACLISAAPQLCETVEDGLDTFKLIVAAMSHDRNMMEMVKPHIAQMELVLAKARGEQSERTGA